MEISLIDIIHILLKRLWVLVLASVLGFVIALSFSMFFISPQYTSTAQLYVNPNVESGQTGANLSDLQYSQRLVNSYLIILRNNVFLQSVANDSGLDYSASQIKSMLSLTSVNNTEIFEVSISSNSPSHSFTLVNKILELAPEEIIRVREFDTVKVVAPATLPSSPSSPNISMNAAIGFILGLFAAVGVVFLIETLDTRIKSEKELTDKLEIPVLGIIPDYDNK